MKTIVVLLLILSFSTITTAKPSAPAQHIKSSFINDYQKLIAEIEKLDAVSSTGNWSEIESRFFAARIAYKQVETLFEYYDRQFVKDHINGAPLLKIERKAPELNVLAPSGFQIAEEELMARNRDHFQVLTSKLHSRIKEFSPRVHKTYLTDRMVFEAFREEIIRLAALGITGFDTPSSENTISECKTVLGSLKNMAEVYYPFIQDNQLKQKIIGIFKQAEGAFDGVSFDSFNRFQFIKNFVNPIYEIMLEIQQSLFIETRDLGATVEHSVNYTATNIFDTDFLNYKFFSKYSNSGIEDDKIALGKILFFDPVLSHNNQRACASCHHPEKAFTDGVKTSLAFNGEEHILRNSPGLINSIYNTRFFWDARATTPEEQIEHVIFNEKEFNTNYNEIISKLKQSEEYTELYNTAFPEVKTISKFTTIASISAYVQSLRSFNSKFDQMIKTDLTDKRIEEGFNIFTGKAACATCHFIPTFAGNVPPLYSDTETEVLGIPDVNNQETAKLDTDRGRYKNGRPKEQANFNKHAFKTPTLRNIALTAPYMHNGVFNTLEEVVDFYDVGGGHGWGIAPENTTLPADSLHLTDAEKTALILFMESLTDTTGMSSVPYQLPKLQAEGMNDRKIGGVY